jgi:trans-aconitate 2-methyltransferase
MEDHSAIVEWYKGTGLRPYLAALRDGEARERFLAEYLSGLERVYSRRPDGRVLFPFRRIFSIAYR